MATPSRHEILVVCLVESSVDLLHEWSEILLGYISPLLQRIAAGGAVKGSKNDFRIGFVSYSDHYIHPNPILAKRFFSQPAQFTKELKDNPASLGLGRTASGSRTGMAVLEGYVAVLEMFDALADTRPPQQLRSHPPNEAQSDPVLHEPTCHLIHVASTPPNKASKPSWNTNPVLDAVTWASLPSELLKRNIKSAMILTRPIRELLDLYDNISRTPEPFWLKLIRPSHKLLLSGLPPIPKDTKIVPQKRPATDNAEATPHPPPRPRSQERAAPPSAPASPPKNTTSSLSLTLNSSPQRPANVTAAQPPTEPQPQPQSQPQPQPQPQSHPQPQPQPQPTQSRPPIGQNLDPVKLLTFIRNIEVECRARFAAIAQARDAGKQQSEIDGMQAELNQKVMNRSKLVAVYQQVAQRQQLGGASGPNQSAPLQAPQQLNATQVAGQVLQAKSMQDQPDAHMVPPNANTNAALGGGQGAQVGQIRAPSTGAPFANFGGPNSANNNPFQNIPISARSGMEAQMQKMLAERTRPPVLAAAPQQSQPSATQNQNQPGTQGNPLANPGVVDVMAPRMALGNHIRRWQGLLAWPTGPANAGTRKENQIAIALFSQDANLRAESWPSKLMLQPSRVPSNMQQIQTWNKEHNPSMGLISYTPIAGNVGATNQNVRMFRQLKDLIQQKNMIGYCKFDIPGGPPGTGFLTFPMNTHTQASEVLVAMIFHNTSLPAALTAQPLPTQTPADAGGSNDNPPLPQNMKAGATPLQMTPEAWAFLQHRQAAALAAYNHQQLAHQQAQQKGLSQGSGPVPGSTLNMAQFMPNSGENQTGSGGLNLPQAPALQQVQHRQPSSLKPGHIMGNYSMP